MTMFILSDVSVLNTFTASGSWLYAAARLMRGGGSRARATRRVPLQLGQH